MSSLLDHLKGDEADLDEQEFAARRSASMILWIVGAFFLLGVIWAAFTELDRTVMGMGRVVPSSKMQVVSNLEGGVIQEILVKPGQMVKKGDILVRLSPTLTGSELGSNEASVDALRAKVARLSAEVSGGTPNYAGVPAQQIAIEQSLHAARKAELQGLLAAGNARAAQADSMLAARRSNLAAAQRELEMIEPLAAREIVSRLDLVKAQNAVTVAQSEVAAAQAAASEARSATAQARSDWLSRAGLELTSAQAELNARQRAMPALSDKVDRTTIRAPMTGRVNRVLVTTVGGTVSAGMPVAEIVPSDESLYIEAAVRPQDIGNVRMGQKASVEITAYRSTVYGKLDGEVISISPDAVLNEKTGESFYTVEVRTSSVLVHEGQKLPIGPGMIANVSLLGDKRSVLSYIFSPLTRVSEHAFRE
ncbi:MAG TPA: HlyD family type I secretion periplasmic adaptor subunit [Novosphingobium sp.]|nr:HlyD family type I secretion periplasmic adaptor subunit [Novosphingobium sp.]